METNKKETVNYLIAACSHRAGKIDTAGIDGKDYLKLHLEQLVKTNTQDLTQVTLIRAMPLFRNNLSNEYWEISDIVKYLKCKFEILDVEDMHFSYSSWIHACLKYQKTFDYSVLVEDDYYPSLKNFAPVLKKMHDEKFADGGYLCGFCSAGATVPRIAAVSNGFVDNKTFLDGINSAVPNAFKAISFGAQALFGHICFNDKVDDYVDQYRTLFWNTGLIKQVHPDQKENNIDIFRPIQYLALGEKIEAVSVSPRVK